MKTAARHPLLIGLFMTVLAGSLACAHTASPPRSEPVGTHIGRIGIVAVQDSFSLALPNKPARGAWAGAGKGALTGMVGSIEAGFEAGGWNTLGGMVFSPGFGALGALIGAAMAPSAAAVDEAEAALTQATVDLKPEMHGHVMGVAQSYPSHAFVLLPPSDPPSRDEQYYRSLSREGVDAILEIAQPTIALKGSGEINPSLKLSITVGTNLIRTEDSTSLYAGSLEYQGGTRTFTEWGANDAQAFREEVDRTIEGLAKEILTHLFGPAASPARQSESP